LISIEVFHDFYRKARPRFGPVETIAQTLSEKPSTDRAHHAVEECESLGQECASREASEALARVSQKALDQYQVMILYFTKILN